MKLQIKLKGMIPVWNCAFLFCAETVPLRGRFDEVLRGCINIRSLFVQKYDKTAKNKERVAA